MTIDAEALAADLGQHPENKFVGHVVTDEDRHPATERRMRHQFADAFAFADAGPQDFEHRLAQQQLGRFAGKRRAAGHHVAAEALFLLRRASEVQRKRVLLVFHEDTRTQSGRIGEALAQILRQRFCTEEHLVFVQTHFGAMPADRRQTQRRKQTIEISDRTAADQRNGSAGQIEQALERLKQRVGNMHFARRRTDIDDRAIHVEQKRNRFQIKLGKNIHDGSLAIGGTTIIRTLQEGSAERPCLARHHLDVTIDAGNDLEFALVNFAFVASNSAIFALGENHTRKGADRFLDDVAARREHRPGRVGERLAALVADQLERDRGGTMGDRDVGQLAGLHANVGAHDRICVTVVRHDVVSALRHHDHITRRDVFGDRTTIAGLELATFIDVERNLAGRNAHIADLAFDAQPAGRQIEIFVHGCPAQVDRLDGRGQVQIRHARCKSRPGAQVSVSETCLPSPV